MPKARTPCFRFGPYRTILERGLSRMACSYTDRLGNGPCLIVQRKVNTMSNVQILNKRSNEIAKTASAFGKEVQIHLVDLMMHVIRGGKDGTPSMDVTPAAIFHKAVAKATEVNGKTVRHSVLRSEAIKKWLQDMAFVIFKNDGTVKCNTSALNKAKADDFKAHIAKAKANPWFKYQPESNATPAAFDIDAAILSMIESIERRQEAAMNPERISKQTAKARAGNKFDSPAWHALQALKAMVEPEHEPVVNGGNAESNGAADNLEEIQQPEMSEAA